MRRRLAAIWRSVLVAGVAGIGLLTGRRPVQRTEGDARAGASRHAGRDRRGASAGDAARERQGWRKQARMLGAQIVALPEVQTGSMETVGKHVESDLSRYTYVLTRVKGSLLDVGCGHGIFLDAYEGDEKAGVDIQARGEHAWPFHLADATALPFPDGAWDTVSAQEMLEHQPDDKIEVVLAELRRVARERLLITVPFCERRLSKWHPQRFDANRVRTMFPAGRYSILDKGGRSYPWVLIEEDAPRR